MIEQLTEFLYKTKEKDAAVGLLDALLRHSSSTEQLDELAKCYFKIKEYQKSIHAGELAYGSTADNQARYLIRSNLINVYNHANMPEKAMTYIKANIAVIPNDFDTMMELSYSLFLLNRKTEAEQILRDALKDKNLTEEQQTKIRFNLGTYHMYRDEFQTGLKLFLEEGAKMKFWNVESIFARSDSETETVLSKKFNKWDGTTRPGATIILHAEAGIGDEIINIRFMKHIKDRGMRAVWYSDLPSRKDLEQVFVQNGYEVITDLRSITDKEVYYLHSMHTPVAMKLEYPDLWYGPYLKARPDYIEKWENEMKSDKIKIGIRWQGNPEYDQDLHRSVPLKDIYEQLKDVDADFYSIQRDVGLEELPDFPGIIDMSDKMKTWNDTLGIFENLDYIITSCTSVAHAASAMGKRTFVLVPISAYYVWSHSMEQSPWYGDNVTILRQEKPRTWQEPTTLLGKHFKNLLTTK